MQKRLQEELPLGSFFSFLSSGTSEQDQFGKEESQSTAAPRRSSTGSGRQGDQARCSAQHHEQALPHPDAGVITPGAGY